MFRKWMITVFVGIFALGVIGSFLMESDEETIIGRPLQVGDTIPPGLEILTITGERETFGEHIGRVVLINYWASWCAPCIREMPSIFRIYDKLRGRGFAVIAVNMDDNPHEGENFLRNKVGPAPFAMYQGMNTQLESLFPLVGLPFSALIDKQGKIVYAAPGEEDWSGDKMRKLIEGFL